MAILVIGFHRKKDSDWFMKMLPNVQFVLKIFQKKSKCFSAQRVISLVVNVGLKSTNVQNVDPS